jgi:hypothetical protein
MRNMAPKSMDMSMNRWDRRPVLTAMMVYSIVLGLAALLVAFAVWRETIWNPGPTKSYQLYMVRSAPDQGSSSQPPGSLLALVS